VIRLSATCRRRLLKLGSVLVLLLAVAPQVLYLGQPLSADASEQAVRSAPPGHEEHARAADAHASHCHVGPKGCAASDSAVPVASFGTAIEILENSGSVSAVDSALLPRSFVLWHRPEKPPQPV
jgi:hypothetical protein